MDVPHDARCAVCGAPATRVFRMIGRGYVAFCGSHGRIAGGAGAIVGEVARTRLAPRYPRLAKFYRVLDETLTRLA